MAGQRADLLRQLLAGIKLKSPEAIKLLITTAKFSLTSDAPPPRES